MRTFLIVGYPRSRTAWLANFLTHGNVSCGHELLFECGHHWEDLPRIMDGGNSYCGSAETAAAHSMPQILAMLDYPPTVLIQRKARDVMSSLRGIGVPDDIEGLVDGLQFAALQPQCMSVQFDALDNEETCREILHHVAPGEHFDARRFRMLRDFNVQVTGKRIKQISDSVV